MVVDFDASRKAVALNSCISRQTVAKHTAFQDFAYSIPKTLDLLCLFGNTLQQVLLCFRLEYNDAFPVLSENVVFRVKAWYNRKVGDSRSRYKYVWIQCVELASGLPNVVGEDAQHLEDFEVYP
jgi:hypothetical protein